MCQVVFFLKAVHINYRRGDYMFYSLSEERARALGEYIVKNKATVREASKYFSVSKSTVHTDVAYRLQKIDRELWLKVKEVLKENKQTRHIRGGMATKEKYLHMEHKNNWWGVV